MELCIYVHLHAFFCVLAWLLLAVVICVSSVIILLREAVSVVPQYVLEAGHALRQGLVGRVTLLLAALVGLCLVLVRVGLLSLGRRLVVVLLCVMLRLAVRLLWVMAT